jgi:hypothetical protein
MNTRDDYVIITVVVAAAAFVFSAVVFSFTGCAEMESNNTKSLLSAAGFHTLTPQTALQKEIYAALPADKVQRVTVKNRTAYVFKDEKAGIAYVGHEAEYQRYKDLCIQQRIAQDYYMATAMDPYWSGRWSGAWGYRGMWW